MAHREREDAPIWLELSIDRAGDDVRVSARGSRGEQVAFRSLGIKHETLVQFAVGIERAANHGQSLTPELLADAQAIHHAMMADEIGLLWGRLDEAAQGPLFVRIIVHDRTLQSIPWEALCPSHQARGFWAVSADILPVRGILSSLPWQSTEVESAVRVLAIAPSDSGGLANLRQALEERIATGEVEWLEPLTSANASRRSLLKRLCQEPFPHVIHFVGHSRVTNGIPALRMADDEADDEAWLDVELFAQEIATNLKGVLRLVVLEACEGARQTAFSSAAEIVARAGVDAVIAHVWPVRANVAQTCSTQLYRTLVGAEQRAGNVALAMNDARRSILSDTDASAEAMSPVLYLHGTDGTIFNFEKRHLVPIVVSAVGTVGAGIGAIVHETIKEDTRDVTDVVKPDSSDVASAIPDNPIQQSHEPQAADLSAVSPKKTPSIITEPVPQPPNHENGLSSNSPPTPVDRPMVPRMGSASTWTTVAAGLTKSPLLLGIGAVGILTLGILAIIFSECTDSKRDGSAKRVEAPESTDPLADPKSTLQAPSSLPTIEQVPTAAPEPKRNPKLIDTGEACWSASRCKSGFCVDGVCCAQECAERCRACSVSAGAKVNGECAFIPNGSESKQDCGSTARCDGQGGCATKAAVRRVTPNPIPQ